MSGIQQRREALAQRLAELRQDEPPAELEVDDALVSALAGDPTSNPDWDEVAKVADRHADLRNAVERWNAQVMLLERAIGKVDAEIAAADDAVRLCLSSREDALRTFLVEAHQYLATRCLVPAIGGAGLM